MAKRFGALCGTGAKRLGIALVLLSALVALPALARALTIDISGDVSSGTCAPCHADLGETDNPGYVFSHGSHITYQCRTCHPIFPHSPAGTDLPDMKRCFNCHGLTHGPQGVIATGTCTDCHKERLPGLRPASHGLDWAMEPHVAPANERLISECSMCHTRPDCDGCHAENNVVWDEPAPMIYDAGKGCLACHGNPKLMKTSALGIRSYQVVGLEASAHSDLSCPDCHTDFAYGPTDAPTNVWHVNAGISCASAECHGTDDPATDENEDQATAYRTSVHGTKLAEGDMTSATCGSCHGSHTIRRLDTAAARLELKLSGEKMCGECHKDRWDSYDDPYHGAAYKSGAEDAPSCWECHSAHDVLPSTALASPTHEARLAATCAGGMSGAGCHQHKNASEAFVKQTSGMIHGQYETRIANPIFRLLPFLRETAADDGSP